MADGGKPRPAGNNHAAIEVGNIDAALEWCGRLVACALRRGSKRIAFIDMGSQFIARTACRRFCGPPGRQRLCEYGGSDERFVADLLSSETACAVVATCLSSRQRVNHNPVNHHIALHHHGFPGGACRAGRYAATHGTTWQATGAGERRHGASSRGEKTRQSQGKAGGPGYAAEGLPQHAADPPVRGKGRPALRHGADRRLLPSVYRPGSRRGRHADGASARATRSSPPTATTATCWPPAWRRAA